MLRELVVEGVCYSRKCGSVLLMLGEPLGSLPNQPPQHIQRVSRCWRTMSQLCSETAMDLLVHLFASTGLWAALVSLRHYFLISESGVHTPAFAGQSKDPECQVPVWQKGRSWSPVPVNGWRAQGSMFQMDWGRSGLLPSLEAVWADGITRGRIPRWWNSVKARNKPCYVQRLWF